MKKKKNFTRILFSLQNGFKQFFFKFFFFAKIIFFIKKDGKESKVGKERKVGKVGNIRQKQE